VKASTAAAHAIVAAVLLGVGAVTATAAGWSLAERQVGQL
jgi:uncharacterized membrane protein